MPITQPSGAIVTIGSGTVSDAVFSPDGQTLYAVRNGTIFAYGTSDGREVGSWAVGQTLGSIDISADGQYLITTEQQAGPTTGSWPNYDSTFYVYKLDVTTGTATTYTSHVIGVGDGPYFDAAFVSSDSVLLSQHYYGSGWQPLTTLDLQTGVFTASNQEYSQDGALTASADDSHVLFSPANISDAPLFMYTSGVGVTASHQNYADGIQGFNSGVQAINANGTMVAEGVSLAVYDGSLHLIMKLGTRYPEFTGAAGLAFSPDGSKLYLLDRNAKEVFVLSTSSWDVLGGYPVGADVTTGAIRYGNALQVSADGTHLAVIGTVSLQVIDLGVAISDAGTSAGDESLSGDGGRDYLFGFGGNDVIDGGLSGDVLYGGSGNDTYYVESPDDQVIEWDGGGADTIYSSINFSLPSGVETLVLTGSADVGSGTPFADTIIANDLGNQLYGNAGDDLLRGGAGNDWIVGGTGNDRMEGGAGNDTYFADSPADVIIEDANAGTDEIVATFTYALPDNVEKLTLSETAALNGTGNGSGNTITGNVSANLLSGLAGDDTLSGSGGDDTLIGGLGNDTLIGGAGVDVASYAGASGGVQVDLGSGTSSGSDGNDTLAGIENITGSAFDDLLAGDGGANRLDGGAGNDTLAGQGGDDAYVLDSVGDAVVEQAGEGTDRILASFSYGLGANLENLTLTGTALIDGTGNDLNNQIVGNDAANLLIGSGGDDSLLGLGGDDRIDGGTGNDTLNGGAGNDILVGREGNDLLLGSDGADLLLGVDGDDQIDGGIGNDTLDGGEGNDTLVGRGGNDLLLGSGGNDLLIGLDGDDQIDGGTGADTLDGGQGNDTLVGREGSDLLLGSDGNDLLIGSDGDDQIDGGTGIDTLDGGEGNDTLVGRDGDDLLIGSGGNDLLLGSDGNDRINGGAGNDQLDGGNGDDILNGGGGEDILLGGAGSDLFAFREVGGIDRILDFTAGADKIDLNSVDANVNLAGDQAFSFLGTGAFTNTAGQLRLFSNASGNYLLGDVDGNGSEDLVVHLGSATVVAGDLFL